MLILLQFICLVIWLLIMVIAIKAVYKQRKLPAQELKWQLKEDAKGPTFNIERNK